MGSEYSQTTEFLQGITTQAMQEASNNAARIYSLPPPVALRDPTFSVDLVKPKIGPPPVFSDLFNEGDSTDPTIRYLNEQADALIAKHFPAMNGGFRTVPEENLLAILSGVKPFGIDTTIFDLVWHQARDRAQRTVNSQSRSVEASFSSRGFTLPPGPMVDALAQIRQSGVDAVLDVSREQAIKDADIKQRMLEIALQMATQMKVALLSSMADYYRMWITLPDKDIERARIKAQGMQSLYGALSSYYNVEISFEELRLRAEQIKAGIAVDVDRNRVAKQNNSVAIASGLGAVAGAFADIAASASQAGGSLTAQVENL